MSETMGFCIAAFGLLVMLATNVYLYLQVRKAEKKAKDADAEASRWANRWANS
jgi:hypothetical protein